MHEQAKIAEARYFLGRLVVVAKERDEFNFNLSAFLSAARSVLQYALEEANPKTGGRIWYNAQVAAKTVVRFFKDQRDISIHCRPVTPKMMVAISVTDDLNLSLSDWVSVTVHPGNGTKEVREFGLSKPPPPETVAKDDQPTVTYQYSFADWPGPEDVLALCRTYLTEIESIVADGKTTGFLS